MESNDFEYRVALPIPSLADFVESFWMLVNPLDEEKQVVVVPDGRIDISFSYSAGKPYHVSLVGLGSEPIQTVILPRTIIFAVSFNLPALEYLLDVKTSSLVNAQCDMPLELWGITVDDLNDFDGFCKKVSEKLAGLVKPEIDDRKINLFRLIYSKNGALTVKELAEKVNWSSRQINRYFTRQFGISLKSYCNILRFKASFLQIKEGKLYPEQNFSDQAHFIRDVKKFSGVPPKELAKNKNDRFIQFSVLSKK